MLNFFEILRDYGKIKENIIEKEKISFGYDKDFKILEYIEKISEEKDGFFYLDVEKCKEI